MFDKNLFKYKIRSRAELQISRGIKDKTFFFLFLHENICCDPSLEPSRRDGSNDGSQNTFYGEIWLIIPKLSLLPLLIWSTAHIAGSTLIALIFLPQILLEYSLDIPVVEDIQSTPSVLPAAPDIIWTGAFGLL